MATFAPVMQESILDIVRQSHDKIDVLVDKIANKLRKGLLKGDEVNFTVDDKVMKGEVVEVIRRQTPVKINLITTHESSPSSDKENDFVSETIGSGSIVRYNVRINGKTVSSIPPYALKRSNSLPSSDVIKKFILSKSKYVEEGKGENRVTRWNLKGANAKKRKASGSPAQSSAKKSKTSKTPVQKNTLDAFMKINKPNKDAASAKTPTKSPLPPTARQKSASTPEGPKSATKKTPTKTPETKAAVKKTPTSESKKRNTPNKMTSKSSVIDITDSPNVKKTAKGKVLAQTTPKGMSKKTKPCTVDLSKDRVSSKTKGVTNKTTKDKGKKTTPVEAKAKLASLSDTDCVNSKSTAAKQSDSGLFIDCTSPPKSSRHLSVDLDDDRPTTLPVSGTTNTSVSVVMASPTKQNNDSPISLMMKETTVDHHGNTEIKFRQLGQLVHSGDKPTASKPASKKAVSTNGLKQLTLFDLKMKSPDGTTKDQFAEVTPPTPTVIRKLKQSLKGTASDNQKNRMILKAAKELTPTQLDVLPSPIKSLVQEKVESLQRRQKQAEMTDDEKRALVRERLKRRAEMMRVTSMKYEDQTLTSSKPIPEAERVTLPDDMMDRLDDVMFVSCFLLSFQHYLIRPESLSYNKLTFNILAEQLSSKDEKVQDILSSLLQTVVNDFTFSEATELGLSLKDIVINKNTLSNLLYLTLHKASDKEEGSAAEKSQLSELADLLKTTDCKDLSPHSLLDCLKTLCTLLLDGQGIVDFQEECQNKQGKIWKQRNQAIKELYEFEKEHGPPSAPDTANNSGRTTPVLTGENGEPIPQPQTLSEVIKLKREMSKRSAEEREKRQIEEKKNKEINMKRNQLELQKAQCEDKLKECVLASAICHRITPLGTDRVHSRYWLLPSHPGVYVEKGWVPEYYHYNVKPEDGMPLQMDLCDKTTNNVPEKSAHEWYHFKGDETIINALIESLNKQGYRESVLHNQIKNSYRKIVSKQKAVNTEEAEKKNKEEKTPYCTMQSLKEDLDELEDNIRSAGLGGVEDYDEWSESLRKASDLSGLGECLLECQAGVIEKYRCKVMVPPKPKKHNPFVKETEEDIQAEKDADKPTLWKESVRSAHTISRLYVLMEIVDICVTWEKSVDNVKCRICKRKGGDATLLLCDSCDLGFHMSCLRITEKEVPEGDWFCPSCKPPEERSTRNNRSLKDASDSESEQDSDDEEESSDEETESCVVCNTAGEEVALCDTCLSAYHKGCHQPPLRAVPRLSWTCHTCRFGTKMKKTNKKLDSSIDSESQASSNAGKSNMSGKKIVVPTTKSSEAASKDRTTSENKRSGRSTRNSSIPDSDAESEGDQSGTENMEVDEVPTTSTRSSRQSNSKAKGSVKPSSTTRTSKRSAQQAEVDSDSEEVETRGRRSSSRTKSSAADREGNTNNNASKTRGSRKSEKTEDNRRSSRNSKRTDAVDSDSDPESDSEEEPESDSQEETDDEIEMNLSQEQEKIQKLLSPKKSASNAKLISSKGTPKITLMDFMSTSKSADKKQKKEMTPDEIAKRLKTLHSKLWAHRSSWPFEYPVDKEEVPDYYDVITSPMDLSTMLDKLEDYTTAEQFAEDIRQMIFNSFDYNPRDSQEVKVSTQFEDYFVKMLNKLFPHVEYKNQRVLFGY